MLGTTVMRRVTLGAALVALVAVVGVSWSQLLHRVPVLPGVTGCRFLDDRTERMECVADRFVADARGEGLETALVSLQRDADEVGEVAAACHGAAHDAAPRLVASGRLDEQLEDAATRRGDCAEGLYHGLMIHALSSGDDADVARLAASCGSSDAGPELLQRVNCVHSIGHAVAAKRELAPAVADCHAQFPSAKDLVSQCLSGAFMQYGMDRAGEMERTGDVSSQCAEFLDDRAAADQCFAYIPSNGANIGWSSERSLDACGEVEVAWGRRACVHGVGNGRLRDGGEFCVALPRDDDVEACSTGFFARNVVSFLQLEADEAAQLCVQAPTKDAASACARGLGAAVRSPLWPEPGLETCEAVFPAAAGREACAAGYGSTTVLFTGEPGAAA